jgi:cytochrome c
MVRFVFAAVLLSVAATPAFAADGAQVFEAQCKMCHQAVSSEIAPSLAGVAGAKIAARDDFAYTQALKDKNDTWTDTNLDAFLKAPSDFAPGTKMFAAPQSDENRSALIDYLKTLK